ncbi:MAG: M1 family metallopeptidase [Gemmatimonadota bacterium]|nr:M1 family metallopeptidase [Gemmatimonadota bacterium]MDE3173163.1 M1 family metallopeptidase [Gemmatimonadota bacterium]MDE3216588.1 M1 family metallopeptidase [Gemmatimonadota bacterium]
MRIRSQVALTALGLLAVLPAACLAQAAGRYPERPVRRDIPMTDMIRRAFAAGTRDSAGTPGPNYWQLWTDYAIDARFDPATGLVTGREHVVVDNAGPNEMREIVLRLDQNLFAPNVPRAEDVTDITDGMQVTALKVNGQDVALNAGPPARFFGRGRGGAPPPVELAAYELSQTSATITLPTPVPAHGRFTLDAEWHFTVPRVVAPTRGIRMGAWGDTLYQVGQWYPRVAVFDDLRQGGWDTEPYLGPSEFYNNFGHFDVKLDVPAGWLVGATGVLQNPDQVLTAAEREGLVRALTADSTVRILSPDQFGPGRATAGTPGSRLVWHFVADTAGDVAWATSNQFVWDGYHAEIPGTNANVPINVMYLPGHAAAYADAGPTVRHALQFYSRLWMPYAFPTMTMVDGPELGMEYPMFIMSSVGASDHETGHEWWPMMLGTNETWYPFMDEGFNQYMNILSAADRAGHAPDLDGRGQMYGRTSGNEREAPLMWDANYGGPMYSFQGYAKAPMMLSMLGGVVGDTAVWRAMSAYAHAWRFKHPSPWDYMFFMDRALHRDLGWFWYSWLFTTDAVDGSVQNVSATSGRTTVTVHQAGEMPSPVVLNVHFAPKGPALRRVPNAVLVDDSTATLTYPVDVWFAGSRTFKATFDFGPRKIERIVLDPHCRFPDADADDNTWPRQPAAPEPAGRGFGGGRFAAPVCKG